MKPIKKFTHFLGWIDDNNGTMRACVLLNDDVSAHTSRVVGIGYDEDGKPVRIETRNSLYLKD